MLKIKVVDWYDLYKKHTFEFNEGITCLIGKNGSGKSTLLNEIKKEYKDVIKFYYDNNYSEKFAMDSFLQRGNIESLARNACSSEGQNIRNNFEDAVPSIGAFISKCIKRGEKKALILLDGLDSGISLDYIIKLKKELFPFIIEDCKKNNIEIYILIAANTYELCNGEDCVRVSDAKHFRFNTYEDFKKIYLK